MTFSNIDTTTNFFENIGIKAQTKKKLGSRNQQKRSKNLRLKLMMSQRENHRDKNLQNKMMT